MGSLKQLVAITAVNLKTIPQRLGSSSVAVIGIAGVVIVFVAVLSIAEGFQETMQGTGSPSKALIMRAGADTELSSILIRDAVDIVKQAPGIAPGSTGPMASAELFVIVDLPKKSTGTPANVPIRGVQPEAVATRDALRVVEGRMFEFGRNEVIVGQSGMLTNLITTIGYLIAFLMGIGAVSGAINTMYNAVASRTREIATLRALGFGSLPVVASVIGESLVLASIGGLIGGAIAYLAFNGYQTATMNFQTFSQVAFAFAVTPALLMQGLVSTLVMGFGGGLFPAIRAARLPIVTALREL